MLTLVSKADPLAGVSIGDSFMGGFYAGIIDTTVPGSIIAADASQTGLRYALILGGKSLETSLSYKTSNDAAPGACSTRWDGLSATTAMGDGSGTYPAADYCVSLSHDNDGASAWYLPALDERELIYRHLKPTTETNFVNTSTGSTFPGSQDYGYNPSSDPAGAAYTSATPSQTNVDAFREGGAQALGSTGTTYRFWTATEYSSTYAWAQDISGSLASRQSNFAKQTQERVRPVRRLILT
jgi:hypothetical protein